MSIDFFRNRNRCSGFLMLFLFILLSGQDQVDSLSPTKVRIQSGRNLWMQQQYDSAYAYFRQAQQMADSDGDLELWAMATQLSGMYLSRMMRLEEASQTLDSVIAIGDRLDPLNKDLFFAQRERAYVELMKNNIGPALSRYEALLAAYATHPPSFDSLKAETHMSLGQAYFYQGDYEQGLASSLTSLEIYESLFDTDNKSLSTCLNTVAIMYMYMSQYEEALDYFQQAHDMKARLLGESHAEVIQVRTNMGVLYGEMGLFWKSVEAHRQNLPYLDSLSASPHLNGLLNMGNALVMVGEYEEALRYLDQAEDFLTDHPGMTPDNYAYLALQRSVIYEELGKHDQALTYIKEALVKNQEIYGTNHPALFTDYLQLGSILSSLENYDSAQLAYRQALDLANEHLAPNSLKRGHAIHSLGETAAKQERWDEALQLFDLAQQAYLANGNPYDRAKAYANRAEVWRSLGDWDSTLAMHRYAWEILMPDLPFQFQPDSQCYRYWRSHSFVDVLLSQAESVKQKYEKDQEIESLQAALASYQACLAAADSQRQVYQAPQSKSYWLQAYLPMLETAIGLSLELYQMTLDQTYVEQGFLLAEKSKASNLRDHLRGKQALHFAGIPDSMITREQYFHQRLLALDEAVYTEEDSSRVASLQKEAFDLRERYRTFLSTLEQTYPAYFALKYADAFSVRDVQESLASEEVIYSYFWGKEKVFVFRLTDDFLACREISLSDGLQDRLETWLDFISQPPQAGLETNLIAAIGRELALELLPDLNSEIHDISVIPHGPLGYLPFETLLSKDGQLDDMRSWPYLSHTWTVSYAYALELWLQQQDGLAKKEVAYIGFAPDFAEGSPAMTRSELGALTFNQQEVEEAAELLDGLAYVGSQASEATLKSLKPQSYLLHLATHALADEEDLMNSRLYLETDPENQEDGILYAHEIYGLEFNSPLTILSACQTGRGPLLQGEGVMSLSRAFQYAGSQQVLTTLWAADDQSGAFLTTQFLKSVVEGQTPERALQQARKAWMAQSDTYHCHPYFWASYVLIGEGSSLSPVGNHTATWLWLIGSLILVGLFSLGWFYRQHR